MANDGQAMPLGDVAHIVMGLSPKGDTYNNDGVGEPLLNGPTEFGSISPSATLYTTDPSRFSEPGDILFCVRGSTTGRMNWADRRYAIGRGIAAVRAKTGSTDTYYIYSCINHYLDRLLALTSGSVFPSLSTGDFYSFEIPWPDDSRRCGIVKILRSLDDKIELNRRMNRTLESMASAIFKSWFIDFDPVVDNALRAGNPIPRAFAQRARRRADRTGLPAKIAKLFPDRFEKTEGGEIPKGWKFGPLAEIAALQTKTIQPSRMPDVSWEHYSIPAYDQGEAPKAEVGSTIKSGKYAVPEGSVLVSKLNPQFPRVWLPGVMDSALAICSTEFMPFVSCRANGRSFVYEMMKSRPLRDAIKAHVTGSTGSRQRVKPKEVGVMSVVVPEADIRDVFSGFVVSYHDRLLLNRRQNRMLAGLRDTLLPKLLSDELELSVAETIAEEASDIVAGLP